MINQLLSEFQNIDLGDPRRKCRTEAILKRIQVCPSLSFPRIFPNKAELEAFYRFVENPFMEKDTIIAPHLNATLERAKGLDSVLIIHDSTKFVFSGDREGLFTSEKERSGSFWGHCSFAVDALCGRPLGVVRMHTWVRESLTRSGAQKAGLSAKEANDIPSEHARWWEGIQAVSKLSQETSEAIHVCDSEGDCYDLLASISAQDLRYVIRGCQNRRIEDMPFGNLRAKLLISPIMEKRTVNLSKRPKATSTTAKRNRVREGRVATLAISSEQVTLLRSKTASSEAPKQLKVNVVYVRELDPKAGCDAIDWMLLTSEKIETAEDLLRVIDIYRNRWVIEEYFKALKTGCSFEKRQLESYEALQRCLALFIPVAWLLLHMRALSRQDPSEPAEQVLPTVFLDVLRAHTGKPIETAQHALLAVAALGGHIKNNGAPGWLILLRGFQELAVMVCGYLLALKTFESVKKKM